VGRIRCCWTAGNAGRSREAACHGWVFSRQTYHTCNHRDNMCNKRGGMVRFPDTRCPGCRSAAAVRGDRTMVVGTARNATFTLLCSALVMISASSRDIERTSLFVLVGGLRDALVVRSNLSCPPRDVVFNCATRPWSSLDGLRVSASTQRPWRGFGRPGFLTCHCEQSDSEFAASGEICGYSADVYGKWKPRAVRIFDGSMRLARRQRQLVRIRARTLSQGPAPWVEKSDDRCKSDGRRYQTWNIEWLGCGKTAR
jgi:hypothetical protein